MVVAARLPRRVRPMAARVHRAHRLVFHMRVTRKHKRHGVDWNLGVTEIIINGPGLPVTIEATNNEGDDIRIKLSREECARVYRALHVSRFTVDIREDAKKLGGPY